MAWTLTKDDLTAAVAEARAGVAKRRTWRKLAMLARGLRWLDESAESKRMFHDAATDAVWRTEEHYGGGNADSRARTAGLFALAGDLESAREWGRRALDGLAPGQGLNDIPIAVDTLYVCGEPERALALAHEHGIDGPSVDLLEAERDGDLARCDAMIARVTRAIVAERLEPTASSALYPLHQWDWLEAGFTVRARLAGEPVPSHASMLERAGLLGPGASRSVVQPQPGGVDRFPVVAADGAQVEVTVDRRDPSAVEVVLDPREDGRRYLVLVFHWREDERVYGISVCIQPQTSPQEVLPFQGPDFGEAVAAAADWFDGSDYHGRDGTWAARTLRELAKRLPLQ